MTNRVADVNGYYEVARNPLSKVGVFPYTKKSVGFPGWESDPAGIVQVYRPEEELADPETLKSFRLLPWVDDHAMLGNPETDATLTPVEKKGAHGTIGEQISYDPADRTMYGNIKLWSSSLADAIEAGKKELSMGFRCLYEFTSGVFEGQPFQAIQRTIRGNHQASVDHGRMGPGVAVLDHFSFALDASELKEVKPMAKVTRRIALSKKLGCSPIALAATVGMDKADAATLTAWNATMDAEEDAPDESDTGNSGMTLEDIADVLGEVGPSLAKINEALAAMAGAPAEDPEDPNDVNGVDEDMEPMLDAMGNAMMDAAGAPMMKKKAAPAADASGLAACDAAIASMEGQSKIMHKALKGAATPAALAAMDAALVTAKNNRAKIAAKRPARRAGTGTDAALAARLKTAEDSLATLTSGGFIKGTMQHIAQRDTLAKRISNFVGTFDASEMTVAEVAAYGADKFGLKSKDVAAVEAYLHNRQPAPPPPGSAFGLDSAAAAPSKVSNFIAGSSKAA